MSPSPARAPENDRLGPWPEEGFGLIPKSRCCPGSHPWYELLTASLEVLTTHRAVCKPEAASEGVAFLFADSGVRVRKTRSSSLRMFGYLSLPLPDVKLPALLLLLFFYVVNTRQDTNILFIAERFILFIVKRK